MCLLASFCILKERDEYNEYPTKLIAVYLGLGKDMIRILNRVISTPMILAVAHVMS